MKLKPFLTVSDITPEKVTIGVTHNFRVEFANKYNIQDSGDINVYTDYLGKLNLVDMDEGEVSNAISRTISFFSIFTKEPQHAYKEFVLKRFLILGVGGLGSRLALELAALGAKELFIVDNDIIETSNLQRMFWTTSGDLGKKKTTLIKDKIAEISPLTIVHTSELDSITYCHNAELKDFDFIFITADADDGSMSDKVGEILWKSSIPHLIGGYWEASLLVGPLIDKNSKTSLFDMHTRFSEKFRPLIKRDFIPPSIGASNSIIAGIMINECIKYFVSNKCSLIDRQLLIDLLTLRHQIIAI